MESAVSVTIGAMTLVWVAIDDAPGPDSLRGVIERGSIALLSNSGKPPLDAASATWLGGDCPRERVVASDLWNQNHVGESYDPGFLDTFERLVDDMPSIGGHPIHHPAAFTGRKTNAEQICDLLARVPDLDDDEISVQTGISPRQQVNQICRRLETRGVIARFRGASGKIVNRLGENRPPGVTRPESAGPTSQREGSVEPVEKAAKEVGRVADKDLSANRPSVNLVPRDLASTLIVLPCSGSKDRSPGQREVGEGILDRLPPDLSRELLAARESVCFRAKVDERTLVPAWKRYTGTLYKAAGVALGDAVAARRNIVILSGGYGVVLATEPIGHYEAVFKPSWWPDGLLERVLRTYAETEGITSVRAFVSASTSYRRVVEKTRWGADVNDAFLLMPVSEGGGALRKVPQAQGEALASFLADSLTTGWRSTDGLRLDAMPLETFPVSRLVLQWFEGEHGVVYREAD